MTASPLLVIGLDGVDFRYLNQFSDSLSHLESLRETGTEADLRSTHPPWTGSAWPSTYTGVDPSHHGVFSFFDHTGTYPDEADAVTRHDVDAPAIWDYLTERELRSVVVNVPITHPAEELEGVLLPGYLAPPDADGYPPGSRSELWEAIGEPYDIYSEFETAEESKRKIDGYEALIRNRADAATHLLETEDWDFAFVEVQKTDAVFHNSTSTADFRRIYEAADELVGRLLGACESEPNVVVCSDHGIGPVTGYSLSINDLLHDHGYIETIPNSTKPSLSTIKNGTTEEQTSSSSWVDRLISASRKTGLTPGTVYRGAQRVGVEEQLLHIVPDSIKQSLAQGVDWRESEAYCRSGSEQGIRINLEGRDPAGVVPRERYEQIRGEITDLLSAQTTPDGEPIFEYVCRREELYDGPYTEDACDILFRTTEMNHLVSTSLYGHTMVPADTYNHKDTGVFVASGPDIKPGWGSKELSLLDVAPIIFSLLEQPIPERLQGQVPDGLTATPVDRLSYDNVSVEFGESYSQDQADVTERLSDLGYL